MFVIHRLGPNIAVSERVTDTSNTWKYRVRQLIKENKEVSYFGTKPQKREMIAMAKLVAVFYRLEQNNLGASLCNPSKLSQQISDVSEIAVLNGLLSYLKSEFVFQQVLKSYKDQEPEKRFGNDISLDIYRQCCDRLNLETGLRLIAQDRRFLQNRVMSRHQRECFLDVFYEISMRSGHIGQAVEFLEKAFKIKRTPARAEGLVNACIAGGMPHKGKTYLEYLRLQGRSPRTLEDRYARACQITNNKGHST